MINKLFYGFSKKKYAHYDSFLPFESLRKKYDLILHIGAPKSGTSALQNFLLNNRKLLLEKGIHYPEHGLDKNGISGGHSQLAIALMENRLNDAQKMFDDWFIHAENTNNLLLLSSESFFNLEKKMEPLLKNKKVLIVAYHRNIVEYLASVHNQLVKRHFCMDTFTKYCEPIFSNTNKVASLVNKSFSKIYDEWETLVGKENLIVRSYQKESFIEGKIEKDFINRMGLDFDDFIVKGKKINISYTEDALEIKRIINFVLAKESSLNHKIDLKLQKYSEENSMRALGTSTELNLRLKSYFAEDEELIQNRYLENYISVEAKTRLKKHSIKEKSINTKSLQKVVDYLVKDKKIKSYLLSSTLDKLRLGYTNYSVFKLAEMLYIENLRDYETNGFWFNSNQLKKMAEGKYKEVDFLRDIARLLEEKGDLGNAEKIIQQALKLRPNGAAITEINEAIKKSIIDTTTVKK